MPSQRRPRPIVRPAFHHTFLNLDHGMKISMYYQDPEGNGVEIQVDAFGNWSRSKEWMWASEEFGRNPIGAHFDPARMVADRRAGVSAQQIHRRARAGNYVPDVYLPELWRPMRLASIRERAHLVGEVRALDVAEASGPVPLRPAGAARAPERTVGLGVVARLTTTIKGVGTIVQRFVDRV